jgi:hypothetical protein
MKKMYENVWFEVISLPTEDVIRTSFDNVQDMEQYPERPPLDFVQ